MEWLLTDPICDQQGRCPIDKRNPYAVLGAGAAF
jgi:hypothetical protein